MNIVKSMPNYSNYHYNQWRSHGGGEGGYNQGCKLEFHLEKIFFSNLNLNKTVRVRVP